MNKYKDTSKINRKQVEENKKQYQKKLDKEIENTIDKAFAKYPHIFKKVK